MADSIFGDAVLRSRSYRLIYKITTDDEVHVIAFVNSARDLDTFLVIEDR